MYVYSVRVLRVCVYINEDAVCLYAVIEGFHGSRWRLERSLHFHAILFEILFSFCRQQENRFRGSVSIFRNGANKQTIVEFSPQRNG